MLLSLLLLLLLLPVLQPLLLPLNESSLTLPLRESAREGSLKNAACHDDGKAIRDSGWWLAVDICWGISDAEQ